MQPLATPAICEDVSTELHIQQRSMMQVLQGAVCPEVKMGLDDAVSAIASVTEVAVSNDLSVAKVYISVYSDQHGRDIAMRGLSRLEGYALQPLSTCKTACCPFVSALDWRCCR